MSEEIRIALEKIKIKAESLEERIKILRFQLKCIREKEFTLSQTEKVLWEVQNWNLDDETPILKTEEHS